MSFLYTPLQAVKRCHIDSSQLLEQYSSSYYLYVILLLIVFDCLSLFPWSDRGGEQSLICAWWWLLSGEISVSFQALQTWCLKIHGLWSRQPFLVGHWIFLSSVALKSFLRLIILQDHCDYDIKVWGFFTQFLEFYITLAWTIYKCTLCDQMHTVNCVSLTFDSVYWSFMVDMDLLCCLALCTVYDRFGRDM